MAPCTTSLGLLCATAVLLVTAAVGSPTAPLTGGVSGFTIFRTDRIEEMFDVLRERQCLPNDFDVTNLTATTRLCISKVESGSVSAECVDVPALVQVLNCIANSNDQFVTVDGVKSFNIAKMEKIMLSFTEDDEWNRAMSSIINDCKQKPTASLGPPQQAVYNYMCIRFSLYANCDRQQAERDASAIERLERSILYRASLLISVLGDDVGEQWNSCNKQYNDILSIAQCTMNSFADPSGLIYPYALFEKAADLFPETLSDGLQDVANACGPQGKKMTVDEFMHCWANDGLSIFARIEAYQVAESMPETCTILV